MTETAEHRLKRLHMRSWRRGMKEMDLILGGFADRRLAGLNADQLAQYEALLAENDQDLYRWITARVGAAGLAASADPGGPAHLAAMLDDIANGLTGE